MSNLACHCHSLFPHCPPRYSNSTTSTSTRHHYSYSTLSCCCTSSTPTTPALHKTLSAITSSVVIACLRAPSADVPSEAARAALSSGISVLEIVMSTPRVFQALPQILSSLSI